MLFCTRYFTLSLSSPRKKYFLNVHFRQASGVVPLELITVTEKIAKIVEWATWTLLIIVAEIEIPFTILEIKMIDIYFLG